MGGQKDRIFGLEGQNQSRDWHDHKPSSGSRSGAMAPQDLVFRMKKGISTAWIMDWDGMGRETQMQTQMQTQYKHGVALANVTGAVLRW